MDRGGGREPRRIDCRRDMGEGGRVPRRRIDCRSDMSGGGVGSPEG